MIRAYKIWYDTKHYVAFGSTENKVIWTTDINKAVAFDTFLDASRFFHDYLGFHINESLPDSLKLTH